MKKLLIILFLLISFCGFSQQSEQYSQYSFNNFGYNPAFLGTVKCMDIRAGYRMQWIGFEGAPRSKFASLQYPLKKKRSKNRNRHAVGLYINQDEVHRTTRTMVKGAYAYTMRLSSKYTLSAGIFAGIQQYATDFEGLENSSDPVLASVDGSVLRYPDIMPGILLYNKSLYWSFSINQLYFKNINLGQDQTQVNQYYFGSGHKSQYGDWTIFKSVLLKWNIMAPPAVDLNLAWMYREKISFGLGYRVGESAIANLKFNLGAIKIGYAFDYPLNKLSGNYGHEIMLGFSKCNSSGGGSGGGVKPYVCPAYN
jgi:type IX secretion system PorP/SprF family membrane protein